MNDEERKAIHDLKILRQGIGILNCIPGIEKDEVDIKAIDIVINLINKQEKAIDRMAEKIKKDTEWFYSEFDNKSKEEIKEYFMEDK